MRSIWLSLILASVAVAVAGSPVAPHATLADEGQVEAAAAGPGPYVSPPFPAALTTLTLREIALAQPAPGAPADTFPEGVGSGAGAPVAGPNAAATDPVVQREAGPPGPQPLSHLPPGLTAPSLSFAGQGGANPPDPVGDVGPSHYLQMVNSTIRIWDKTGTSLVGPVNINQLWINGTTAGTGFDQCRQQNAGDPIVLYDQAANRWMVSQFTSLTASGPGGTFPMCIAYSQTGDPTLNWFLYQFNLPASHDYMKYGIWPDALYMSTWEGGTLGAYAFDRTQMLTGAAATFQYFSIPGGNAVNNRGNRILPSDWDGATAPPAGAPNFFTRFMDDAFDGGADRLEIWEFHVDWGTPANSTFGLAGPLPNTTLNTAPFDSDVGCGQWVVDNGWRLCIPQSGGQQIDALANRLMHRLQYRNFGSREVMVVSHTVDIGPALNTDVAGLRWYELRDTGAGWAIFQQGTYGPADGLDRWMPSMAMDGQGNIAMGYSVSSSTTFPGLRYTGRLATDAAGTMPQPEQTIVAGSAAETTARWGDYSSMNVDPVDECTFWYTGEHSNSATFIAAFSFNGCLPEADLRAQKTVAPPGTFLAGSQFSYTLASTNDGPATAVDVSIADTLPAGTGFVSAVISAGATCPALPAVGASGPLVCSWAGNTASGVTRSITVTVSLTAAAFLDYRILNTMSTTSGPQTLDVDLTGNTSTAELLLPADLAALKTQTPDVVPLGSNITWTLASTNNGPAAAQDLTITDTLPNGTAFVSATPSAGGVCGTQPPAGGNGALSCTWAGLTQAGVTRTVVVVSTVTVDALSNPLAQVVNTMATTVPLQLDPDPTNNTSTTTAFVFFVIPRAVVPPPPSTDIALAETSTNRGRIGVRWYTFTLSNVSDVDALGVDLWVDFPANVRVDRAMLPDGCSVSSGRVHCSLAQLGAQAEASFEVKLFGPLLLPPRLPATAASGTADRELVNNHVP